MRLPRVRHAFVAGVAASTLLMTAACGADEGSPGSGSESGSTPSVAPAPDDDLAHPDEDVTFRAGEYEAEGSYNTPGGVQRVEVELDLSEDGTITDLDVDGQAESGNSVQFQGLFESGIEAEVVGKKITELTVTEVSGSSLTSDGFNAAIADIIGQAQQQ